MWQPWSKLLEILGRVRFPLPTTTARLVVGRPDAYDAMESAEWKRYTTAEALFDVWGPLPESRWEPFHCVPLFVALERIEPSGVGPPPLEFEGAPLPPHARPGRELPPRWASPDTMVMLDLPGEQSVPAAIWMAEAGYQPVCTFNNWPHPKGILKPEKVLAQLLRWASLMAQTRQRLQVSSPPVWICDRDRLGERPGKPGEFDNRYYLDDSLLPGAAVLKQGGINRVLYVTMNAGDPAREDVGPWFTMLQKGGIEVRQVALADPALRPGELVPPPKTPLKTDSYRRSSAGGFGSSVPEPSSGGGG